MSIETTTPLIRYFKWWYKGKTPEGNICSFQGTGWAKDADAAGSGVEEMMRKRYPEMKWMQGKEVEGEGDMHGALLGPTVHMLKKTRPAG